VARPSTAQRAVRAWTAFPLSRAHVFPIGVARAIRDFIRPAVVPVSITAAGVILAIPILFKLSSTLLSLEPHSVQRARGASSAAPQAHREGERRTGPAAPAPRSARIASPIEPDMPLKSATSALGHKTGGVAEMWAASSPSSPSPREFDTETSPEAMTPQSKVPTTSRTRGPTQSVPEALLRGGS